MQLRLQEREGGVTWSAKPKATSFAQRRRALMEATAHRIEPGRVIGEAFATYRSHVGPLLGGR
jgi:hypothetical protein